MGTLSLGELTDNDGTKVQFFADYSDTGQRRVNRVRVINGTTKSCRVTLLDPAPVPPTTRPCFYPTAQRSSTSQGKASSSRRKALTCPTIRASSSRCS